MNEPIATVIVDDEPLARLRVEQLLHGDPGINLVGVFDSAKSLLGRARELSPQLLLLDIRMPEVDGFELVTSLAARDMHPCIIFITAHSDRPMDAFAVGAVDYLLKPFDKHRFARAVDRARTLIQSRREAAGPTRTAASGGGRSRLMLTDRGRVTVLPMRDIEFVQAAAKHVKIFAGGACYTFRQSLREVEGRLDPGSFVRVHRSTLVNIEHIAEMHAMFHGDYELITRRGTRLTLSRRYRDRLKPFMID